MRVEIDGSGVDGRSPAQIARIVRPERPVAAEGAVRTPRSVALGYYRGRVLPVACFASLWALPVLGGAIFKPETSCIPWSWIVLGLLAAALVATFGFRIASRWIEARATRGGSRYVGVPPVGTRIGVGEQGLTVGGRRCPWDSIQLEGLRLSSPEAGDATCPLRAVEVELSTPMGRVKLDEELIERGRAIVGEISRRLLPGS